LAWSNNNSDLPLVNALRNQLVSRGFYEFQGKHIATSKASTILDILRNSALS